MIKSAFRYGFDRDLCRTALEDPGLGARVLAERPKLEGGGAAELIAGGRAARSAGPIPVKLAIRLAGGLLELGAWEEALQILEDPATDFTNREATQHYLMARALAGGGRLESAKSTLAQALELGLPAKSGDAAVRLAEALGAAPSDAAPEIAGHLCALGLPALAADVLTAALDRADRAGAAAEPLLEAAFGVLRLGGRAEAIRLLEAMAPLYRAEGRAESLRSTLAVLDGAPDAGVESESETSSASRMLLRACLAEACAAARDWPAAIRRFDYAGKKWREPPDSLCELARCVGRDLLDGARISLPPSQGPRRVVDLFPYNGEAAMLQMRLRETADWIAGFVLVEAGETFPGRPKPLHFRDDPAAAAGPHVGRITPIVVPRPPGHIDYTWAREFFQKDCSVLGLDGLCGPDDLVILSDVDEILARAAVEGFQGDVASGALRTFRFFINCELVSQSPHLKAAVTHARQAAAHGWNYLRLGAIRYRRGEYLPNAGWHFSSIGSAEWLGYKMQCTAHEEWSYMDKGFFERMLPKLRRSVGPGFHRCEIDDSFPACIRENREALADFIL